MEIKTFLKKKLFDYILVQTGIQLAMGIMGSLYVPEYRFGYSGMLMPFLYALICIIPTLFTYSKKELPIKKTIIRNILSFLSIELIVYVMIYGLGGRYEMPVWIAIGISVLLIFGGVTVIDWLRGKRETDLLNVRLAEIKSES